MVWGACVEPVKALTSEVLGVAPMIVALACIFSKEALFRLTHYMGVHHNSPVLLASAKHHRTDAMSSVATAVGTGGVLVGVPIAETLAVATTGSLMIKMAIEVALNTH